MTVAELIAELQKLPPEMEVATGFPAVTQGEGAEYQASLCRADSVREVSLSYETWMGQRFVLIETWPEVIIG